MWLTDRLASLVTGLGTAKDKGASLRHHHVPRDRVELDAAYRDNWIARKAIDIVPFDMLREWRAWQADERQVELIEAAETTLGLQTKLLAAMVRGRLYGGGAILIGTRRGLPTDELAIERLPKDGIAYLHVLSRHEIAAGRIELSPLSPYYGEPTSYEVRGAGGTQRIHPSRVIRFLGAPLPEHAGAQTDCWSDSILQAILDAVDQASSAAQHIAAMLPEAKQDIISVPGLSQWLNTEEDTKKLTERFAYAAQMKSLFGILVLEGDGKSPEGETYQQKQLSFAALPEVARLFLQIASGAADIPVTRMLGQAPAGLNATGDSDTRNYYDHVAAKQKVELTPTLRRLDRALLRHALGDEPKGVWYAWNPLYQPTEKEKADISKVVAETAQIYANLGLVPDEVLAEGVKGRLIGSDTFPGIGAAYDAHQGPLVAEDPPQDDLGPDGLPIDPGQPGVPFRANDVMPADESDDAEVEAVTGEDLEALFGPEMLAQPFVADASRVKGGGHSKPFREGDHPRAPDGTWTTKGGGGKLTKGAAALKSAGVGMDDQIAVLSKRITAYKNAKTVGDFVENHPKGRAYALRKLAADHKAGRIGFKGAANNGTKAAASSLNMSSPQQLSNKYNKDNFSDFSTTDKATVREVERDLYKRMLGDSETPAEIKSVKQYSGHGYTEINGYLRGRSAKGSKDDPHQHGTLGETIRSIDGVLSRSRMTEDVVVYRGVKGPFAKKLRGLSVGKIIEEAGYTSTSLKSNTSHNFAGSDGVVLKLLLPKGNSAYVMNGRGASQYANEHEVLLPRNSRFRVREIQGNVLLAEVL